MVRGLDLFREYFAGYADQFVLIGGTAASLARAWLRLGSCRLGLCRKRAVI